MLKYLNHVTLQSRAALYRESKGIKQAIAKVLQCIQNVNFQIDPCVGEPHESAGYVQMQSIARITPRGNLAMEQYFRNHLQNAERLLMNRQRLFPSMADQGGRGRGNIIRNPHEISSYGTHCPRQ